MKGALFRKPAKQPDRTERYAQLGLRRNPFPQEPALAPLADDPRLNGEIYCDEIHEELSDSFTGMLLRTPDGNEPSPIAFLMDMATSRGRGIGKSAFLKHQQERINKDLGATATEDCEVAFACHILPTSDPKCTKVWQFVRLIALSLVEDVVPLALGRTRAFVANLSDDDLNEIGPPEHWSETLGNDTWMKERSGKNFMSLQAGVTSRLERAGVNGELARVFARTKHDASGVGEYLDGWSDHKWRREGGTVLFDQLVRLFVAAEFTRGLFLVDEVEKIVWHQNTQERRAFVESIRNYMVDGDCENVKRRFFGMLLTIHPGVQELLIPYWGPAGLDRLAPLSSGDNQRCVLRMGPLDVNLAIPLVK